MKFYTLDFDCNTPTVQQVNIPTNTDYKLGIKVRRNGEMQNLSPDSVKLYTGETITVEPNDYNADRELATSIDSLVIALLPASISADLGGKTINTVVPEVSYDNGATWGEVHITETFDQYFFVMDKSQGNYYYARLNLKNPNSKWELLDGTKTGVVGTADTITMPTNPQAFLNSSSNTWSITQFPCIFRLVIKYGGYSYPVYIEPDADKTNGYVTFTLSSDDSASYTQETLSVVTNVDIDKKFELYHNTSGASTTTPPLSCLASEIGLTGKTIKPEDIYVFYKNNSTTEPTEAELALSAVTYWGLTFEEDRAFIGLTNCALITGDQGTIWAFRSQDAGFRKETLVQQGLWDGKTPFFFFAPSGASEMGMRYDYTFDGSEIIRFNDRTCSNNNYNAGYFKSVTGEAFSAKFDLNTNIFKSQQGDIADGIESASTAKLTGAYADGTEFDYDIVIA